MNPSPNLSPASGDALKPAYLVRKGVRRLGCWRLRVSYNTFQTISNQPLRDFSDFRDPTFPIDRCKNR
jgi:hypothetical protein